jgi:TRAP-type mannitol/chloroaromatic compound transport system permease small subunit
MEGMLGAARRLDAISRRAGEWIGWIIIPLIVAIMFDVIARKLDFVKEYFADITVATGYSVSFLLQDAQWHMHAVLLMFTFGFGYLANAHVRVDIFREMLGRRGQARLELFLLLILGLPFLAVMIRYSFELAWISFWQGEGSESLTGIGQRWIIKTAMLIGFLVLLAAVLATILRLVVDLYGDTEQQQAALDELAIFSDESDELEAARLEAERALEAEKRAHGR